MFPAKFGPQANRLTGRQSNIELLRIISMILIVANHFASHSDFEFASGAVTLNQLWVLFLRIGGKISVDVFVLISGYFSVSSKSNKTGKVIKLWLQIFTYSALIYAVFVFAGFEPFSIKALIKNLMPITFSQWWFASTFFVLYLLMPYINKLLNALDQKQYKQFLLLLFVIWCFIPTFTARVFESNNLLWFFLLYAFAGYVRLYNPFAKVKAKTYLLLTFAGVLLIFLSAVVFILLGTKIPFFESHYTFLFGMQKIPVFAVSLLCFLGFTKINIGCKPFINVASSSTFGVYLIHDNDYLREFLWKTLLNNASYAQSKILIPYSVLVIAAVFTACSLIELARIYLLENHYMKLVNKIADKIDSCKEKIVDLKILKKN